MKENAFKEIIQHGIIPSIVAQEAIPRKGKPAQKPPGSKTVYILIIRLGDKESILEAARGGPREWSSLDKLDQWLKANGISSFSINHADSVSPPSQEFAFANR